MASPVAKIEATSPSGKQSRALVTEEKANELIFAVVGHVGSGTTAVADALKALLVEGKDDVKYDVHILKAREVILDWAKSKDKVLPPDDRTDLNVVTKLQDLGDEMRRESDDNAVVARSLVGRVRRTRADIVGEDSLSDKPITPDGKPRAYILDSIRHPAEVHLLRHVYQDAFVLIGVVCDEDVRQERITNKYKNAGGALAREFMQRDARAKPAHGQRVSDAFLTCPDLSDQS